jgi:hypothetical protein
MPPTEIIEETSIFTKIYWFSLGIGVGFLIHIIWEMKKMNAIRL